MDDIKAGVQYIFQTKNTTTFALSATGHAAMECVMNNMLEPGRTVLICNNGIWGVRSADMARRQGATVKELNTATGTNFSLEAIEHGIKLHKPDMLFVTHGESSTGVIQPLEGLGPLCHANNCLLAVDTVREMKMRNKSSYFGSLLTIPGCISGWGTTPRRPAGDRCDLHGQPKGSRGPTGNCTHLILCEGCRSFQIALKGKYFLVWHYRCNVAASMFLLPRS